MMKIEGNENIKQIFKMDLESKKQNENETNDETTEYLEKNINTLNFGDSENSKLLDNYGVNIFKHCKKLEILFVIPSNFLERHSIDPYLR